MVITQVCMVLSVQVEQLPSEVNRSAGISEVGKGSIRVVLYEAAMLLLRRSASRLARAGKGTLVNEP